MVFGSRSSQENNKLAKKNNLWTIKHYQMQKLHTQEDRCIKLFCSWDFNFAGMLEQRTDRLILNQSNNISYTWSTFIKNEKGPNMQTEYKSKHHASSKHNVHMKREIILWCDTSYVKKKSHVLPSVWRSAAIPSCSMCCSLTIHRGTVCVCVCVCVCTHVCVCAHVCVLWKCMRVFSLEGVSPFLWPYITLTEESRLEEEEGEKKGTRRECMWSPSPPSQCDLLPSAQRKSRGPRVSWAGRGGARLSRSFAFPTLVFLGSKKGHLFLQSQSYAPNNFSCAWGGIATWNKTGSERWRAQLVQSPSDSLLLELFQ